MQLSIISGPDNVEEGINVHFLNKEFVHLSVLEQDLANL